jgi:hypothetical protein
MEYAYRTVADPVWIRSSAKSFGTIEKNRKERRYTRQLPSRVDLAAFQRACVSLLELENTVQADLQRVRVTE